MQMQKLCMILQLLSKMFLRSLQIASILNRFYEDSKNKARAKIYSIKQHNLVLTRNSGKIRIQN